MEAARSFYSIPQIVKRALRLDLFNVSLKTYGRNVTRKWIKRNQAFLDYTRRLTTAGRSIEAIAKDRAADIKERLSRIRPPIRHAHSKPH